MGSLPALVSKVTADRDIQEVVSRGLARSNQVFAITLSALGEDRYALVAVTWAPCTLASGR